MKRLVIFYFLVITAVYENLKKPELPEPPRSSIDVQVIETILSIEKNNHQDEREAQLVDISRLNNSRRRPGASSKTLNTKKGFSVNWFAGLFISRG